jgi:hypothetical protein
MIEQSTTDSPHGTTFAFVPAGRLESVDASESNSSVYWYECGCVAIRFTSLDTCHVRRCFYHTPEDMESLAAS